MSFKKSFPCRRTVVLAAMLVPISANAGHLFTQAMTNTPVNLNAGQGIQITQQTYESGCCAGTVRLYFSNDWSVGDTINLTIGSWNAVYSFDTVLANFSGSSQNASSLNLTDATLAAANINPIGQPTQWTVIANTGQFTFAGYRLYTGAATFNGTGSGLINQNQVVNAGLLNGGTFVSVAGPGEIGVAGVLDTLVVSSTGDMATVVTLMSAMTPDSKQLAMKLISPERSQILGQASTAAVTSALDTVQVRLDTLRTGVGMKSSFRTSFNRQDDGPTKTEGMSSGGKTLDRNFWVKAFGGKADQKTEDGFAGSDSTIVGLMSGFDSGIGNGMLVGASLAYAKSDIDMSDFRDGDGARIDTYQLVGYFDRSSDHWYLEGMLTYAYQDYKTKRNTNLTGVATGNFNGYQYGMRVIAGIPIILSEDMTLTPYSGLEAHHISQSSYTETGAGVLSLNASADDTDRLRSLVGVELGILKKLDDGSLLRPALKLNWRHEFIADGVNNTASFVGGGGQFESSGQAVTRNVYGLTGRLNWEKTEQLGLSVEVGVEAGHKYRSLNGQLVGSWRF